MAQSEHIRFHALIPSDLYIELRELADKEDRSMASVVRLALEDRLKRQKAAT
jgi:hypothetical protein